MSQSSPSIVIRAYNEEQHIGKLLSGIMAQTVEEPEIILVDSGSTDATVSIAERFPVKVAHIDPAEFTFGRSLNLGCSHATREYIVIASAHVFPVYPDWLEQLLLPFREAQVGLVYGKQRGDGSSRFSEQQQFLKMFPDQSNARQTHPLCNNANAAIRRVLWQKHAYDETLPGLEDLEWAAWAIDHGYHLAYSAEAEVIHLHDETPGQVYNRYRREAIALRRMRPDERFGLRDFLRLYLSNSLSDLQQAFRRRRLTAAAMEILWFRLAQFWGTYRGFNHRGPLDPQLKRAFFYPRQAKLPGRPNERSVPPIDYGRQTEMDQTQ